jgi:high-affinity nickel permease
MIALIIGGVGFLLVLFGAMQLQGEFDRDLTLSRPVVYAIIAVGVVAWIGGAIGLR